MITIIDYGLGNIRAFTNLYARLNIKTKRATNVSDLKGAERIILPGVGAFDHAMTLLNKTGMREELDRMVIEQKVPVIGICVGMQMMAKSSEEGKLPGLGWIDGQVRMVDTSSILYRTKLPHMGWNTIKPNLEEKIFFGLNNESRFYFLHSYYFECNNEDNIICTSSYGKEFASAVRNNNVYGIQFHPEKSHENGINLLNNFSKI